MNAYRYAPKYRPPSECTVPKGWDLVERGKYCDFPLRRDLPLGDKPFGIIQYRRPLSKEELESYELEPV